MRTSLKKKALCEGLLTGLRRLGATGRT